MATTLVMPKMGYDMQEGRIVRWLKQEGDDVARGEEVAEIETDKAVIPMPSSGEGLLRKILVAEGMMVPVGQAIGVLGAADEDIPADLLAGVPPADTAAAPPPAAAAAPAPAQPTTAAAASAEIKASPVARRLATERGIDLSRVTGTGPNGRVTEKDVRDFQEPAAAAAVPAAAVPPPPVGESQFIELNRMRQAVARTTARSAQEAPHFFVTVEVDMAPAMALRQQVNAALESRGIRASVNDLIIKACALALERHPSFNATFHGDRIEIHPSVNIGVAIDLDGQGLIQPAIMRCETRSLAEIAQASRDLVQRARDNHLRAEEYTGSTFTVSNLGMFDVDNFTAIIAPPNCAILAVGSVVQQPVVRDGEITIGQMMKVTLSVDHRTNDGAGAARFLGEVKRLLEHPTGLLV